ncbi:hypothetical protein ACM3CZ_14365 [Edwardsiella ictaluri]|uniref:hypothetical protein n=1 Tax=Edwardsiella ictaluri TaxID=67780 RepID=UPI0039F712AB
MSSKLHGLVWEGCAHAGLILSRVAVMARLADYSNDEGLSWPAVETIQRQDRCQEQDHRFGGDR